MKSFTQAFLAWSLILMSFSIKAQDISGKITDESTGIGIPFVQVYIAELQTGTRADSNGYFEINRVPAKKLTISVSAIGYATGYSQFDASASSSFNMALQPQHVELTEIVVATTSSKLSNDNVMMVSKKTMIELDRSSGNTLMENLTNMGGVDQLTTGTGIGKPIIRGLSGNRVVTYAQGIRVENQQWGSEHGLGLGDAGIGSVELIKGPSSLLYGSDAIGGVLYFTDQDYAELGQVEGYASSRFFSNSLSSQNQMGLKVHRNKYKQNFYGSYKSSGDYQIPDGQRVVNSRFDEKSFKTSLGFNNNYWVTNLRYSYLQNNFGITGEDSVYHSEISRNTLVPYQRIDDHKLSTENIFFIGDSKIELTLGYTKNRRQEFEDVEDTAALDMNLETGSYNVRYKFPVKALNMVIGVQGMYQRNINSGIETLIPDALTNDVGVYSLAQFSLQNWDVQGGLRWDYRKLDGLETSVGDEGFEALSRSYANINASAGALYRISETFNIRFNISTGFRAPNTSELLSDGEHEGSNRYEVGNADLKNEQASQVDIGLTYANDHLEITINPFVNQIRDFIYLRPEDSTINGKQLYYYDQTNALFSGGELGFHYHPHEIHWLHFETIYSAVFAKNDRGNALPLIPANNFNSTLKIELGKKRRLRLSEIFIQHIFKFDQRRTAGFEDPSASYQLINTGLILDLQLGNNILQFKAGVNNLLNTTYIDHLSRLKTLNVPGPGRNTYVGLKYMF
ncbi:MAG: TonB-dependent receptor [Vicingaceae bacterium]